MITLYGIGPGFGLPEVSPYVTKTEVQLRLAGLPYIKQQGMRDSSPKGQLPYIADGDALVADSTFIRLHIEQAYGMDLDAALDARQRAEAWALERMIENHFNWASGFARWMLAENFEKGPARFFDNAPEAVRDSLRRDVQAQVAETMRIAGLARHTPEEIVMLGVRSLSALSVMLGDTPYLFGDRPCGVDATAFAALAGLLTPFFDSPLRQQALQFPNLLRYVDRMMVQFYPEHRWEKLSA
ncbi:glutathione S-transferase family protein [Bradyrhizobium sp. U87765 SZCCT0131]|uniref:glutathione S-transferase family protein n=1 Tax=unclassified Bradyrhizobium TaxID=2631580 RepID=UPI001BA8D1B1|nr:MULTISPECIES: glutathione S-transferase family protein [unclassified Bradyrhizobium]MBR1217598.1 glutathione S-transferase family protein [Bradyrhizobium sp. U87765 SZCCT0131]MBR1264804.1 glutathione S-transferase family protein [Bradyrhizobium sp. U87765 SZCCT0134]MBR1304786.1 glutathione S-transferase family protein [Bradyrhizobium sp. U87765 SZCCT0110]MBR1320573.1 glutathione S-transferase family protein [Bradyrhizobium sp. U87765 SZCCT0109]MBR1348993.1 glutathione S-transferase family p